MNRVFLSGGSLVSTPSDQPKFVSFPVPFVIPSVLTDTTIEEVKINVNGWLTYLDLGPLIDQVAAADMHAVTLLEHTVRKTLMSLTRGYINNVDGIRWEGRLPVDTQSTIFIEVFNASGEDQSLNVNMVIELE